MSQGRQGKVSWLAQTLRVCDPVVRCVTGAQTWEGLRQPAEFSVPLALNDPAGVWRVTAREPFAHQTASASFVVVRTH